MSPPSLHQAVRACGRTGLRRNDASLDEDVEWRQLWAGRWNRLSHGKSVATAVAPGINTSAGASSAQELQGCLKPPGK